MAATSLSLSPLMRICFRNCFLYSLTHGSAGIYYNGGKKQSAVALAQNELIGKKEVDFY